MLLPTAIFSLRLVSDTDESSMVMILHSIRTVQKTKIGIVYFTSKRLFFHSHPKTFTLDKNTYFAVRTAKTFPKHLWIIFSLKVCFWT